MRWQGNRQSDNVEDRRGVRGPVMVGGGLFTLIVVVVLLFMGVDPQALLQNMPQQPGGAGPAGGPLDPGGPEGGLPQGEDPQAELKAFISTVLANTEDVWGQQFQAMGEQYQRPKLVLFAGQIDSACGFAESAMGPFYCPADEKVYLDMSFFRELELRHGAPGDFAQAYVIAHEVGHHVQHLLGISDRVHATQQRVSKTEANELSVRLELQADYLAGVWAHHAAARDANLLEIGDIDEGLTAATAIGDDTLQRQARGFVVPDSFTHGSSEQRRKWFRKGLESGDFAGAQALFELDEL
jgi:predicted metalloprotease